MDTHTDFDPEKRTGTLTLAGACATEDAAGLARAMGELVAGITEARAGPGPSGAAGGQWTAAVDMSGLTTVGMAFFEILFAASLTLGQAGTVLSRRGELPECVRHAAKLTGFSAVPGLFGLFAGA